MTNHEVLSAFIDDEPFDPQALSDALADAEGRALLIDLLALRGLTQPDVAWAPAAPKRLWTVIRLAAAAAALALAVVGGYRLGEHSAASPEEPPAPTRVVSGGTAWQDVPDGGIR